MLLTTYNINDIAVFSTQDVGSNFFSENMPKFRYIFKNFFSESRYLSSITPSFCDT